MISESVEQIHLFQWARMQSCTMPELNLLFHIPNGGKRNITTAKRLKAEGVKAGVPDLFLPVSRGGFFGLFIEMKVGKNKTTQTGTSYGRDYELFENVGGIVMISQSTIILYAINFLESEIEKITELLGKETTSYNDVKLLQNMKKGYELELKELLRECEV